MIETAPAEGALGNIDDYNCFIRVVKGYHIIYNELSNNKNYIMGEMNLDENKVYDNLIPNLSITYIASQYTTSHLIAACIYYISENNIDIQDNYRRSLSFKWYTKSSCSE